MFSQAIARQNNNPPASSPSLTSAAIMPPAFSRPLPAIPPGSLRWFAPVLVRSRSARIADGFPLVFPASEMQSHDVTPEDWQSFLVHIDSMLRSGIVSDPTGHGHAAQMLVGQWSAAFFQPRRIRVTLRPELIPEVTSSRLRGEIDRSDARSISSVSSTSTSSSSSSSSSDDSHHKKGKGRDNHHSSHSGPSSAVITMGTGPLPQTATMMSSRIERRMMRDQRKADRREKRDERKAERRARKMERRERKRERKVKRKEQKAMRKGKFIPGRAPLTSSGRWELIIECI